MKNVNVLLRRCTGDTNGENSMRGSLSHELLLYPTWNGNVFKMTQVQKKMQQYVVI